MICPKCKKDIIAKSVNYRGLNMWRLQCDCQDILSPTIEEAYLIHGQETSNADASHNLQARGQGRKSL